MKRVAIIGSGIAGQMIAHHLLNKADQFAIDWISADSFAPSCSASSTSVVRKAGIESGISPLGDLLLESFLYFENFYQNHLHFQESIHRSSHYECCELSSLKLEQFRTRYPDSDQSCFLDIQDIIQHTETAYIIEPEKLFDQIVSQFKKYSKNRVLENNYIDEKQLELMKEQYDFIFHATGHQAKNLIGDIPLKEKVSGHYIDMRADFLPTLFKQQSWSFSLDGLNLIYRSHTDRFLISAANSKDQRYLASPSMNQQLYQKAQKLIPSWPWPKLKAQHLKIGVRSKGVKRMPCAYWEDSQNAYLNGLYKNGFSFAVKLAYDLTRKCF